MMLEGNTSHLQRSTLSVERDAKERVDALLEMGFGRLEITDDADVLMDGIFEYDDPLYKPEVSYNAEDEVGRLIVRQPKAATRSTLEDRSRWQLSFGEEVPLDLDVHVASGDTSVALKRTHLTALRTKVGSGKFAAHLSDAMDSLEHVAFKTASGRIRAVMDGAFPKLADCTASSASGVVTLSLKGTFPTMETLRIDTASGSTDLELVGTYPALNCIAIDTVSGVGDLNLADATFSDLVLVLNCVSGKYVIRCPQGIGVGLSVKSLTGQIEAPAFHRVGGKYMNERYGQVEATLEIDLSSVSGRVSVQLGGE
mgnify:CR=1 FL=1